MVAYFVRRVVGGVVKVLLAWLVIYSVVVYVPGGVTYTIERPMVVAPRGYTAWFQLVTTYYENYFHLDMPWPTNFAAFLDWP
jgi:predicted membrane channel-forming protein YqfA (hemolysin III family)